MRLLCLTLLLLAACRAAAPDRKTEVENLLGSVEGRLKGRDSDAAMSLFASEAYQGNDDIRRQLESFWGSNRMSQMRFWVDSVHAADGKLLVRAHWQRVLLDANGRPVKSSGRSELILLDSKPLRILEVRGDAFF